MGIRRTSDAWVQVTCDDCGSPRNFEGNVDTAEAFAKKYGIERHKKDKRLRCVNCTTKYNGEQYGKLYRALYL